MRIHTLIFDFGNVIGFFDLQQAARRLQAYTPLSPEEMIRAVIGGSLEHDFETGQLSSAEFLCRVRDLCRLDCRDEVIQRAWQEIFRPNRDVVRLIPRLKGRYQLLLGSNTNELHAQQLLRQFAGVLSHFDHLVLSHKIGYRKPDRRFFEHCLQKAGRAPGACLFVDDLPVNVAGARDCGLNAFVYRDFADFCRRLDEFGVTTTTDSGGER